MEYRGTGVSGPARRPEPSWPTVIATTMRLWVERHPVMGTGAQRERRVVLVVALVITLGTLTAGVLIGGAVTSSRPALSSAGGSQAAQAHPGLSATAALGASAPAGSS